MKRGKKRSSRQYKRKALDNLRREKKKFARKLVAVLIIIIFFLIIAKGIFYIIEKISGPVEEGPGLGGELPSIGIWGWDIEESDFLRVNCSDENLKTIWDFMNLESSNGITIHTDKDADEFCNYSLMYKIMDSNVAYYIFSLHLETPTYAEIHSYAIYGNFTDGFIYDLQNPSPNLQDFYLDNVWLLSIDDIYGKRSLENESGADIEYHSKYKIENSSWQYDSYLSEKYYWFESGNIEDDNYTISRIYENITFDLVYYHEKINAQINLTQTQEILDVVLNGSKWHSRILYLDDYFENLGADYLLDFDYSTNESNVFSVWFNNYNHKVDFDTSGVLGGTYETNITLSHPDYNGGENVTSNAFNVTIYGCLDSDGGMDFTTKGTVRNLTSNGTDYCYSDYDVIEYYCEDEKIIERNNWCGSNRICVEGECVSNESGVINHGPDFLSVCEDIEWRMNSSYNLDMGYCFEDDDNDTLTFRYENSSNSNLSIDVVDGGNLTLIPATNWKGSGYFYVYANDSKEETQGRVDFIVNDSNFSVGAYCGDGICNLVENCSSCSGDCGSCQEAGDVPEIKSASPSGSSISIFTGGNQTFSIEAENYDSIIWYLDGGVVARDVSSYEFDDSTLNEGEYEIKVEVKKGDEVDSKTWNLTVEKEEKPRNPKIYFIIIFVVLGILILFVVLLIIKSIMEKDEEKSSPIIKSGLRLTQQKSYHNFPSR